MLTSQILSTFLLQVVQKKEGHYILTLMINYIAIYIFTFMCSLVCSAFAILPIEKVIVFIKYFIQSLMLHYHTQLSVPAF